MTISEQIFQLYQRFYAQKGVLTEAPPLTIDINQVGMADFSGDLAFEEMSAVASYLTGLTDIRRTKMEECVRIVKSAYATQPFWRELLESYLNLLLKHEEQGLVQKGCAIREETEKLLEQVNTADGYSRATVNLYAERVQKAGFPVDAQKLISNYFKMARSDTEKAWDTLISNPAYFSPIITKDAAGNQVLTPEQALKVNSELASFLKSVVG